MNFFSNQVHCYCLALRCILPKLDMLGMERIFSFYIQQCVEYFLMCLLDKYSICCPRTHDIDVLLGMLPPNSIPEDVYSWLNNHSSILTACEAKSQDEDYDISIDFLHEAFNKCLEIESLLDTLLPNPARDVDTEMLQWCRDNAPIALRNEPDDYILEVMKDAYFKFKDL